MCRNCTYCPLPVKKMAIWTGENLPRYEAQRVLAEANIRHMDKLNGNQNVRNTVNGKRAKETERNDPERVVETDGEKSPVAPPFRGVMIQCLNDIETAGDEEELERATINAMLMLMDIRGVKLRNLTERDDPRCTPEG